MSKRRVVVTGMGMVSPVGNNVTDSWNNILEGKSGIAPLDHFDVSAYTTRFGGSIKDFDITQYLEPKVLIIFHSLQSPVCRCASG